MSYEHSPYVLARNGSLKGWDVGIRRQVKCDALCCVIILQQVENASTQKIRE